MKLELGASGLEWRVDNGRRHGKLYVAGRFVAVLPRGTVNDNHHVGKNVLAAVRRTIVEIKMREGDRVTDKRNSSRLGTLQEFSRDTQSQHREMVKVLWDDRKVYWHDVNDIEEVPRQTYLLKIPRGER